MFPFNEFPYCDAFSVVCDVFQLALEIRNSKVNKYEGEEISAERVKLKLVPSPPPSDLDLKLPAQRATEPTKPAAMLLSEVKAAPVTVS